MDRHRKANKFINLFIPLKADWVFPVSSGNWKRIKINPENLVDPV
jgi:hypothetical protein